MPVADIPVHPLTVDKGRYGCYNRGAFTTWYWGKREIMITPVLGKLLRFTGIYQMIKIPFSTTTPHCVYGKNGGDKKCHDCVHLKTTAS